MKKILIFVVVTVFHIYWGVGMVHAKTLEDKWIEIRVSEQRLYLYEKNNLVVQYPISAAKKGTGNQVGSNQTPLGLHQIKYKIGHGAARGQIFVARSDTGEIAQIHVDDTDTEEDLVLTRIMWLDGLEPGINKGGNVDSLKRYIYIHGTNEEGLIGRPASHGCIRMLNADVIELFDRVSRYTKVMIVE